MTFDPVHIYKEKDRENYFVGYHREDKVDLYQGHILKKVVTIEEIEKEYVKIR